MPNGCQKSWHFSLGDLVANSLLRVPNFSNLAPKVPIWSPWSPLDEATRVRTSRQEAQLAKKVTRHNLEFNHSVIVIIRQFLLIFALVLLPRTQRRSQGSRVIECRNMAVTGRTRRRFAPRALVRSCDFMMSKLSLFIF